MMLNLRFTLFCHWIRAARAFGMSWKQAIVLAIDRSRDVA
jgi:hypothetical protein